MKQAKRYKRTYWKGFDLRQHRNVTRLVDLDCAMRSLWLTRAEIVALYP